MTSTSNQFEKVPLDLPLYRIVEADVVDTTEERLSELRELPCLLLVGPAGSGKTTLMKTEYRSRRTAAMAVRWIDLAHIFTEESFLVEALPLPHEIPRIDGTKHWHVFIDGVDASRETPELIWRWIATALYKLSLAGISGENIRLRIATRPAHSFSTFEEVLAPFFESRQIAIYQIGPLSVEAIGAFVRANLTTPEDFLRYVENESIGSLIKTPVTLKLLLDLYAAGGELPVDRSQLFRRYVQLVLERAIREKHPSLPPLGWDQILLATARLAAAMTLSNKVSIWSGPNQSTLPELATADTKELIPAGLIQTLLDAGLLVGKLGEVVTWAHKTLAEYLTAFALASNLKATEAFDFLQAAVLGEKAIRPQYREVAAWLALLNNDFRDILIASEPDALFSSEIALNDDASRRDLTSALLDAASHDSISSISWRERHKYQRLSHPKLGGQLTEYLQDPSSSQLVKITAIQIALACSTYDMAESLLDVALNALEATRVRVLAAEGVALLGSESLIAKLKRLVNLGSSEDPEDEIRGTALDAVWPKYLTTAELFTFLWSPRNKNLIGSYSHFLYTLTLPSFSSDDAIAACRWLSDLGEQDERDFNLDRIVPAVLCRIWEVCEDAPARQAFAGLSAAPLRHMLGNRRDAELKGFVQIYETASPSKRRSLFYDIVSISTGEDTILFRRMQYGLPWRLLVKADLPWLVEDLRTQKEETHRALFIEAIVTLTVANEISEVEFVWDSATSVQDLAAELQRATTIPLDSEIAKYGREAGERRRKIEEKKSHAPTLHHRFDILLDEFLKGNQSAWWQLNMLLLSEENSSINEFHSRLDTGQNWTGLDDSQREAFVRGAKSHLQNFVLGKEWVQKGVHHRPAAAVYRALSLVSIHAPNFLLEASEDLWGSWALPIVAFRGSDSADDKGIQVSLLQRAYETNPKAVTVAIRHYIQALGGDCLLHLADLVSGCH